MARAKKKACLACLRSALGLVKLDAMLDQPGKELHIAFPAQIVVLVAHRLASKKLDKRLPLLVKEFMAPGAIFAHGVIVHRQFMPICGDLSDKIARVAR